MTTRRVQLVLFCFAVFCISEQLEAYEGCIFDKTVEGCFLDFEGCNRETVTLGGVCKACQKVKTSEPLDEKCFENEPLSPSNINADTPKRWFVTMFGNYCHEVSVSEADLYKGFESENECKQKCPKSETVMPNCTWV